MKILYNKISSECQFPLSRKDVEKTKEYVPSEIINKIESVRFSFNSKTTQEGTTDQVGSRYRIKVNFCLRGSQSRMLSENKKYINEIKEFGGTIDKLRKRIDWDLCDAKRYAFFILMHEIGHVVYMEHYLDENDTNKATNKEEKWCDRFSREILAKMNV